MSKPDDTFLGRWSRKKLEPEVEAVEEVDPGSPEDGEELSDEQILERLELPDPDQLKEGDDFAAFMNSAVPDHLRKRALRKLWLSNPALANLDGLVDYGEDYTDAAMVPEVLNTAYKVGRGFLKDILEETPDEVAEEENVEEDFETAEALSEDSSTPLVDEPEDEPFELAQEEALSHTPRQRMVFRSD